MIKALATIKGYYDYGMFQAVQIAAIMALRQGDAGMENQAAIYQSRRDALCESLHRIGWPMTPPKASMFCWVPIPEPWRSADEHDGFRHDAPGKGQRGRQPRQRLRPGRRRLLADVARRKRSPAAASRAANPALPPRGGATILDERLPALPRRTSSPSAQPSPIPTRSS